MKILFCGNYDEGYITLNCISKYHDIIFVFCDLKEKRNDQIISFCKKEKIECFPDIKINDLKILEIIKEKKIDIVVCNNFKKMVNDYVLESTKFGGINLHSSLLPQYKGRAPLSWAIINGEKNTGISVHFINRTLDGGNIILQRKIPIKYSDTYSSLLERNIQLEPELLLKSLKKVERGYKGKTQISNGKIFPYINNEIRTVDWNSNSRNIYNLIRAVAPPFPGAISFTDNKEFKIFWAKEKRALSSKNYSAGEIINIFDTSFEVFCKPKTIEIFEIQDETGNNLVEIINNKTIFKGLILKSRKKNDPSQ
ncbi:MAG: formyltransferase family protein [Methanoregula sp.]